MIKRVLPEHDLLSGKRCCSGPCFESILGTLHCSLHLINCRVGYFGHHLVCGRVVHINPPELMNFLLYMNDLFSLLLPVSFTVNPLSIDDILGGLRDLAPSIAQPSSVDQAGAHGPWQELDTVEHPD